MQETKLSRRATLKILGATPVVAAAFSACGGKSEPDRCDDVSALSEAEKVARSALQYTDRSPHADKQCNNCNLFLPSADATKCSGCQIVKGPIHPKGYCTGWVQKV